jgi:hypothetical protein
MTEERGERKRLKLKSIDQVRRTKKNEYQVQATYVEEYDRPRSGGGRHKVQGHWETVNGKRTWVDEHDARDPRR